MRNPIFAVIVLASIAGSVAAQDAELPGTDEQRRLYLAGAAMGLSVANLKGATSGNPLFCPPVDFSLNAARMQVLANRMLTGPQEPANFVIAALAVLQSDFQCGTTR